MFDLYTMVLQGPPHFHEHDWASDPIFLQTPEIIYIKIIVGLIITRSLLIQI